MPPSAPGGRGRNRAMEIVARISAWLYRKLAPNGVTWVLLVGALVLIANSLNKAAWVPDSSPMIQALVFGLLFGIALAKQPLSRRAGRGLSPGDRLPAAVPVGGQGRAAVLPAGRPAAGGQRRRDEHPPADDAGPDQQLGRPPWPPAITSRITACFCC